MQYLAESEHYKVYAMHEYVYLKVKAEARNLNAYEAEDQFICWNYGNPNCGVIFYAENYVVIGGCGLTIYNIEEKTVLSLLDKPGEIHFTNGLHQEETDDPFIECRYVDYLEGKYLRVFKLNVQTLEIMLVD